MLPNIRSTGSIALLENQLVDQQRLIANAASGVSGAGRQVKLDNLYAEISDSYKAYAISGSRHLPEIEQGLKAISGKDATDLCPHLVPMIRGMHSTIYAELVDSAISLDEIQSLYEDRFAGEPFVDVMPLGSHPQTRSKRRQPLPAAIHRPQGRDTVVVLSIT